ncbi:MAG: ankyrin repeat domain-containing protein [Legionella sp.]|nr:ankyrin repeat domain-containing protein [Legionella sp.]
MNFLGMSLLHFATECGQLDCIKLLIQQGIDVDFNPKSLFSYGGNALFVAVLGNQLSIAHFLLIHHIDVNQSRDGGTPLHNVQSKEMAELLLEFKPL